MKMGYKLSKMVKIWLKMSKKWSNNYILLEIRTNNGYKKFMNDQKWSKAKWCICIWIQ